MADNFTAGESDADMGAPPIETMGARYGINNVTLPQTGRGEHVQLRSDYIMQGPARGTNETVIPGIQLTPLGGMMPGPNAIAPAIPSGAVGAFLHQPAEDGGFQSGVIDGFPEGCPVPLK